MSLARFLVVFDPGPKTTAIQLEDDKADQIIEAQAETVDALKQHVAEAGRAGRTRRRSASRWSS